MIKRLLSILGIFVVLFAMAACSNKKVNNPIAAVDSKQPDKILFDRAMDAMKHNKFDVARLTLQTLINTYPDSEYVARAKLAIGDSWYAEGGSAAMTQAENEYKDFETFFPNMPEAAEAQLKIANIHYREMEKPDRDYTHAMRAEEEYRTLITQYPDSKLIPEAKQRLLEVQEVLAEREYRIGRFYYMRESYNAAVARLKSLADTYPLYSKADEALFLLASSYEKQADNLHNTPISKGFPEAAKGKLIKEREDLAAAAYAKIITRYPMMDRVGDAKKALEAMHRPVPTPTAQAIAQNKAEEESRGSTSMYGRLKGNLRKGPDMAEAVHHGEPVLVDPTQTSAVQLLQEFNQHMQRAVAESMSGGGGTGKISIERPTGNQPLTNEPAPRSDAGAQGSPDGSTVGAQPGAADSNAIPELKPIAPENSGQDNGAAQTATPPTQLNEVDQPKPTTDTSSSSSSSSSTSSDGTPASAQAGQTTQPNTDYSTNKPKKKKGLRKVIPF
jgi:outer membrane protein assembly factor BamD